MLESSHNCVHELDLNAGKSEAVSWLTRMEGISFQAAIKELDVSLTAITLSRGGLMSQYPERLPP